MNRMESLRERLIDAKLAGRKSPGGPEGVYAYYFRSNEQAADAALAALGLDDFDVAVERACRAYDDDWYDGKDHTPHGEKTWDDIALILKSALTATGESG